MGVLKSMQSGVLTLYDVNVNVKLAAQAKRVNSGPGVSIILFPNLFGEEGRTLLTYFL